MQNFTKLQEEFSSEWRNLKTKHIAYVDSVEKMRSEQSSCMQSAKHCRSYIHFLLNEISRLEQTSSPSDVKILQAARTEIQRKEVLLRDVDEILPRRPGLYLRIVLGALNISFSSKQDKFDYKNDYEQFKIIVSAISAVLAFLLYFFIQNRVLDTVFHFLLVWYYCTLTIRERILIANGSRIKGWWNIYHFISTACAGIMLIWPRSRSYDEFRDQFMLFSLYLNIVHLIQYQYQIGCLYKLRALGDRHPMDITVDGFMSWMFRRLTFTLPFLFTAYALDLYNAYRLYCISRQPYCNEWQVLAVAIIYFVQAAGNIITVCRVIQQKLFPPSPVAMRYHLQKKYSFAVPSEADAVDPDEIHLK